MEKLKSLKIIYMGTPAFSASLLELLIKEGYNIVGVVTQEDAFVGRKKVLTPSPVKEVAIKHNINVFTPHRIRHDYDFIADLKPDLILTFAYGQIVPKEVLTAPRYACLNFHGSILPKYRGASPIQMALINGEKETGVSLMEMVEAMDAGVVYGIRKFPLTENDNFDTVSEKMVKASLTLVKEVLPSIISGENKGVAQDEKEVTFAPLLKAKDEEIDLFNDDVNKVFGKIQAFGPDIGVNLHYYGELLKIYEARIANFREEVAVGTLFVNEKNLLTLQVRGGQLTLLTLQKSGKKRVDARSFLNGERPKLPTILKMRDNHG